MTLLEKKITFEKELIPGENAVLKFIGIEGYDVYNCSIPFDYKGKKYIYGRVEKPNEWARSRSMLFEETGKDIWTKVNNSMIYQIEDPFISFIKDKLVLGGNFVFYREKGTFDTYQCLFYRGNDLEDMYFFAMGPDYMKDIRLVEMPNGKIGLFSRPRNNEIYEKFGTHSTVGFTIINDLDELNPRIVEEARYIENIFQKDEWGGVNQAYYLENGMIGVIGHKACFLTEDTGNMAPMAYMNVSFVFDPNTYNVLDQKIIATRKSFPEYRGKTSHIIDCAFASGIIMRKDGKCDLYSGIGDSAEGRVVIDYPFEAYGKIIDFSEIK